MMQAAAPKRRYEAQRERERGGRAEIEIERRNVETDSAVVEFVNLTVARTLRGCGTFTRNLARSRRGREEQSYEDC